MSQSLVFCQKYQQQLPGLPRPPYPGPRGQYIFEHISQKAWEAWQEHQKRLINEQQLNLMDKPTREMLNQEMDRFFAGEQVTAVTRYQQNAAVT